MTHRSRSLLEVTVIYIGLFVIGTAVYAWMDTDAMIRCLAADLVMTVGIYAVSVWKRNTSAYDAYWSVIPFYFVAWLGWQYASHWSVYQWGIVLAVSYWSWRLTLNWTRSWPGWEHEDWRYVNYRNQLGKRFELMNFFGLQMAPTLMVFGGFSPLFAVLSEGEPTMSAIPGVALMFLGTTLELIADNQLYAFRARENPSPTELLDHGIWGIVRHPNYLGELLFWTGAAACGLTHGAAWYTVLGVASITATVLFASIPFKDDRMASRRPQFEAYRQRVPALIPGIHWP